MHVLPDRSECAHALVDSEPATKKAKTVGPDVGVIRPGVTDIGSRDGLAAEYRAAQPYPHCVISDICEPETLAAVREEIISNVQATYKETDLFNMFQTGKSRGVCMALISFPYAFK